MSTCTKSCRQQTSRWVDGLARILVSDESCAGYRADYGDVSTETLAEAQAQVLATT